MADDATTLASAKAYTDAVPTPDLSPYQTIAQSDADDVTAVASANTYTDTQIAAQNLEDLANLYIDEDIWADWKFHNESDTYKGIFINGNGAPTVSFNAWYEELPLWKAGISGINGESFSISAGATDDDKLVINAAGNVGIGVTAFAGATEKLEVLGNVRATSFIADSGVIGTGIDGRLHTEPSFVGNGSHLTEVNAEFLVVTNNEVDEQPRGLLWSAGTDFVQITEDHGIPHAISESKELTYQSNIGTLTAPNFAGCGSALTDIFPPNMITLFAPTEPYDPRTFVPDGWALCDGYNGTPDMPSGAKKTIYIMKVGAITPTLTQPQIALITETWAE